MDDLLKNQFISYLNSRKSSLRPFAGSGLILKTEITSETIFDIMDKKDTICQQFETGSATYHNPTKRKIRFIDYENMIDQLPSVLQRGIKRCDFIAYDLTEYTFFVLNELSQSGSAQTKLKDAIEQLYQTALYLTRTDEINLFINTFQTQKCVFSNRYRLIHTPESIADAFSIIQNFLPDPIIHENYRINKLGFEFIETDKISV